MTKYMYKREKSTILSTNNSLLYIKTPKKQESFLVAFKILSFWAIILLAT